MVRLSAAGDGPIPSKRSTTEAGQRERAMGLGGVPVSLPSSGLPQSTADVEAMPLAAGRRIHSASLKARGLLESAFLDDATASPAGSSSVRETLVTTGKTRTRSGISGHPLGSV